MFLALDLNLKVFDPSHCGILLVYQISLGRFLVDHYVLHVLNSNSSGVVCSTYHKHPFFFNTLADYILCFVLLVTKIE